MLPDPFSERAWCTLLVHALESVGHRYHHKCHMPSVDSLFKLALSPGHSHVFNVLRVTLTNMSGLGYIERGKEHLEGLAPVCEGEDWHSKLCLLGVRHLTHVHAHIRHLKKMHYILV